MSFRYNFISLVYRIHFSQRLRQNSLLWKTVCAFAVRTVIQEREGLMSNVIKSRKAAVIGCGFVGSATAFTLMQSKLFSELVLLDVNREKADGEAMDISHGVPFAAPMKIYAGDYDDVADAAIIIVTAGANQKPDETRLDLVHRNVEIYKSIIPEIASRNFGGILLIVSNPVDILTYVALRLSGLPENRVIGSGTVLDTARMKYALGEHLRWTAAASIPPLWGNMVTARSRC